MLNLLLYVISKKWRAILTYIHLVSSYNLPPRTCLPRVNINKAWRKNKIMAVCKKRKRSNAVKHMKRSFKNFNSFNPFWANQLNFTSRHKNFLLLFPSIQFLPLSLLIFLGWVPIWTLSFILRNVFSVTSKRWVDGAMNRVLGRVTMHV